MTALALPTGLRTVELGGLVFNASDGNGVDWILEAVDGWDGPAVREAIANRPRRDGVLTDAFYFSQREITLKGTILAPTPALRDAAVQALAHASDCMAADAALVVNETIPKRLLVRRRDKLRHTVVSGEEAAFEVPLLAADPIKYAAELSSTTVNLPDAGGGRTYNKTYNVTYGAVSSGGRIYAVNAGDRSALPTARITGPSSGTVDNPSIENVTTGKVLALSGSLAAGSYIDIDFDARTILLNGTASRRSAMTAASSWWELPPGTSEIAFHASAFVAGSQLTLSWRSAWV